MSQQFADGTFLSHPLRCFLLGGGGLPSCVGGPPWKAPHPRGKPVCRSPWGAGGVRAMPGPPAGKRGGGTVGPSTAADLPASVCHSFQLEKLGLLPAHGWDMFFFKKTG